MGSETTISAIFLQSRSPRVWNARRTSLLCGLLFIAGPACAGASIAGRVHDADGRPLKDVAVTAEAKAKVYSNEKGEFALEPAGAAAQVRLLFELPGYYPESVVCETQGRTALDVALTPRAVVKEEVKVVARSEERRIGKECRSRWSP